MTQSSVDIIPGWGAESDIGSPNTDAEIDAVVRFMRESSDWRHFRSPGLQKSEFEKAFAAFVGTRHAICVNGCGTAIDLALRCLDLRPDDEIISCSIGFHGTHVAVAGTGAKLVLCDSETDGLNIDIDDLCRKITRKTRAFLITHMNGRPCDIDDIEAIAAAYRSHSERPIKVIYDCARSLGAEYKDRPVGQNGWVNTFSFQRKKMISTLGEGGMVTTNCDQTADKIRRMRGFGNKIEWGSNYNMTDLQALVGRMQLERIHDTIRSRRSKAGRRHATLEQVPGVIIPIDGSCRRNVFYFYDILIDAGTQVEAQRDSLLDSLARVGVRATVANPPTYETSPFLRQFCKTQKSPRAEVNGKRLISLPLHSQMPDAEDSRVIEMCATIIDEHMRRR